MKMQIWKVYVSSGIMGAIHGESFPVYEGYIPELKLTVNEMTSFVYDEEGDNPRYKPHAPSDMLVDSPQPEFICETELNEEQIKDARMLATPEENPEERTRDLINSILKEHNISDYLD